MVMPASRQVATISAAVSSSTWVPNVMVPNTIRLTVRPVSANAIWSIGVLLVSRCRGPGTAPRAQRPHAGQKEQDHGQHHHREGDGTADQRLGGRDHVVVVELEHAPQVRLED